MTRILVRLELRHARIMTSSALTRMNAPAAANGNVARQIIGRVPVSQEDALHEVLGQGGAKNG
jgi:hypothetical protein